MEGHREKHDVPVVLHDFVALLAPLLVELVDLGPGGGAHLVVLLPRLFLALGELLLLLALVDPQGRVLILQLLLLLGRSDAARRAALLLRWLLLRGRGGELLVERGYAIR